MRLHDASDMQLGKGWRQGVSMTTRGEAQQQQEDALTKVVVRLVYLRVQVPASFSSVTSGFTQVTDLVSLSR